MYSEAYRIFTQKEENWNLVGFVRGVERSAIRELLEMRHFAVAQREHHDKV